MNTADETEKIRNALLLAKLMPNISPKYFNFPEYIEVINAMSVDIEECLEKIEEENDNNDRRNLQQSK